MSHRLIYIVSGGSGASAELLVNTALAQFAPPDPAVVIVAGVRYPQHIADVVDQAAATDSIIVHTLIDSHLREDMKRLAQERSVCAIDAIGPLLEVLSQTLHQPPLNQPGRYHMLNAATFARAEAIEWTMAHDDGQAPQDLQNAEIVLVGPSRVGKTPTSIYLAALGWNVANVPLVSQLSPPSELFSVERQRVVGLTIDPDQLASHRSMRQQRLSIPLGSTYTDPQRLIDEVEDAEQFFRHHGFRIVNVTNKPIEDIADRVMSLVPGRRLLLHQ